MISTEAAMSSIPEVLKSRRGVRALVRDAFSRSSQPHPRQPTLSSEKVKWAGLRNSLETLRDSSSMLPPLASVSDILLDRFEVIETAFKSQDDHAQFVEELKTLCDSVAKNKDAHSFRISNATAAIASEIQKQAEGVRGQPSRGAWRRFTSVKEERDELIKCCRQLKALFKKLQSNLITDKMSIASDHLVNARIEELNPAKGAKYDSVLLPDISRQPCTEGTRTAVLLGLDHWLDSNQSVFYWIDGTEGTGKTTIAYTFSKKLDLQNILVASFFCMSTSADCRDATRIIPTIAYQLAHYSTPFQSALYEVLESNQGVGPTNLFMQFEQLLVGPLNKIRDLVPENLLYKNPVRSGALRSSTGLSPI
ncbi:hypothetical protein RSOLAG1IB_09099 [Rhizoctonia solani AG-1 IB]|uniref:Nephrocystin 3-like N-terminal domain-containing protein n=1 Tax=Thanatephorus cucumeris (strain AG1-IB / isolate 7/3/14) TaxID=1108050 RepID=A0A0B7FMF2_THACB|nr:hypothetical protein RSOLAG1IB_09099 [Rhizoctonia solani AG-1 IB]